MLRDPSVRILLYSLFLTMAAAAPALAHSELEGASPAEGERLGQAPTEVRLTFSEPVEAAFSPLEVYDAAGSRVDGDDAQSDPGDPGVVSVSLQEGLPAGPYAVRWTVTSADGDPVSGEYSFEVGASSETAPGTTGADAGELSETGGSGSIVPYAGLGIFAVAVLGLFLRGRARRR